MRLRRPTLVLFTLALLVVGAAFITTVVPYQQILGQQARVDEAAAELARLEEDNAQLAVRREALETPVEIERLARQKLGYVRPGEAAYVVLDPPADDQSEASGQARPTERLSDRSFLESIWDFITGADLLS